VQRKYIETVVHESGVSGLKARVEGFFYAAMEYAFLGFFGGDLGCHDMGFIGSEMRAIWYACARDNKEANDRLGTR